MRRRDDDFVPLSFSFSFSLSLSLSRGVDDAFLKVGTQKRRKKNIFFGFFEKMRETSSVHPSLSLSLSFLSKMNHHALPRRNTSIYESYYSNYLRSPPKKACVSKIRTTTPTKKERKKEDAYF